MEATESNQFLENAYPTRFTGEHRVQFYKDDEVLIRSIVEHLAPALLRGGAAVAIATPEHGRTIHRELGKYGIAASVSEQRCIILDARDTLLSFMPDGVIDAERFRREMETVFSSTQATADSGAPIAAFGEMVAVLWADGKREPAVQLEQLWNDFLKTHQLGLLCGYPLHYFSNANDRALFSRICAEHSTVTPAESFVSEIREDALGREIAELQQRAEALTREVAARKRAEEQLRSTRADLESVDRRTSGLRRLSLQILKLQDLERRRVARELHESVGQDFAGLKLTLELAKKYPRNRELWEHCDRLLEHCIHEVRTLSNLLHPPIIEDGGFMSAAEWYVQDFARRTGIKVRFDGSNSLGGELSDGLKLVLFRVLQECLINVYRHAKSASARVSVTVSDNMLTLKVEDYGVGIPAERVEAFNADGTGMGVGLTGVWERVHDLGGVCALTSSGAGTSVAISVPLDLEDRHSTSAT